MRDLDKYLEEQYGPEPEFCGIHPCGCAWDCMVDVPRDDDLRPSDFDPLDPVMFELDRIEQAA